MITPIYRKDYVGETVNWIVDGETCSRFIKPLPNAFVKSNSMSAIVLGNGLTRNYPDHKKLLKINSKRLAQSYKLVYACNRAVHEDETYDYYVLKHKSFLIGVKKERRPQVYLPNDIFLEATGDYNMLPMVSNLDSGASAAMLAAFDGHQKVFLFGFDGDLGRGWQTLYDDVYPYNENKVDFPLDSWKNNLFEVMSAYKDTKFYRLQSDGQSAPYEWRQLPNFKDVSFRDAVLLGDF